VQTITTTCRVASGVFAPGHLGELTRIVPFEMVDLALAATSSTRRRTRRLPARVVVYLLLAGCLFAELGYRQVWHKLTAGLAGLPVANPSDNALWQARGSVPRRCGGCSTCSAARRPPAALPAGCTGAGCWCAPSTAPA
jgi:hypothetical protein